MKRRHWLAACALAATLCSQGAWAQQPTAAGCPESARDMPTQALYGQWEARIAGQDGIATMVLERHPDYDGVRGTLQRAGQPPAMLAGDIDTDGQLALDESQDGKSISASWSGALQPGSCGKEFKGTWHRSSDESDHDFVLHRSSTWK